MNHLKWILAGLLVAAVVAGLVGPLAGGVVQAQDAVSRVRFLHAVPGAPNVDIYLDNAKVASDVAYGEVTPHLSVAAGEHQVALRLAGGGVDTPVLLEVSAPLAANLAFMIVVQGSPDALDAVQYEDILDPLEPGKARLTAVNVVVDAPALDVLTAAGGPLLQGINFGQQFGTINIDAGVQELVFVPAGGAVDGAIADIGSVSLRSGLLYTFVVLGTLEGDVAPSTLVLATPVNVGAEDALVQVAHGSPDAPAVDIYANDVLVVPALGFGEISEHLPLPAGAYTVALRPAGADPASEPVYTADVTFDAGSAVTVAALGELGDGSLALEVFPNAVDVAPEQARLSAVNAVPGSTVSATLVDPDATVLAADLASGIQAAATDFVPGNYLVTVNIQGIDSPVDVIVPEMTYAGGTYYTALVYGGGAEGKPFDVAVVGTPVNVTVDSLPGAGAAAVVAEPTVEPTVAPTAAPTQVPPTDVPPTAAPTELPADDAAAAEPTQEPIVVTDEPAAPLVTQSPLPIAYVQLDPGANLHCRELPAADARSLGLIPSGATLTVLGRTGTPLVPETGDPTPEPTPVAEQIEDLWLSVRWEPEDGGYLRCWVSAEFLRVEFRGRLLDELEELWELPEEPFNRPGEAVDTDVAPPTPVFDAVVATVELEPGVSLQLRRHPETQAEVLDRVPAKAQLEVLGYVEAPSEGLVGQPVDPNWLRVRYRKEDGSSVVGWVSAEYVSLSQLGRPVEIGELPMLDSDDPEPGFFEEPGVQPAIPIEQQAVIGQVNLNPGANLNLRDRPTADARVIIGIPSGETMEINGRNEDGSWVQVTYETEDGEKLDGWVAAQYLIITRGGQPFDVMQLDNLWEG